jgi:NADPH-dependent curcumin reductase CurA
MTTNHRLLLAARPAGIPGPVNFTADAVPVRTPGPGEALLETLYLSIDPAMRSWMDEGTGYQQSIPLGEVMRGGGIARVLDSRAEGLAPGDLVQARLGWQTRPTIPGRYLQKLDLNYRERYDEARTWLAARRRDGSLRQRLHVLEGLAQAPIGLGMLFRGENTGKLVVRVAAG